MQASGSAVRLGDIRELDLDAFRTRVASYAASLAEIVTDGLDGFHLGAGDFVVELRAPEGPSTGGGAHARQPIRLVPRRRGFSAIVVGVVDPVTSTAEVRRYDHVAMLYELRFRREAEIDRHEYAAFLDRLDSVFRFARIRGTYAYVPQELVLKHHAMKQAKARTPHIALVLLVLFTLLAIAAFVVLRFR